MQIVQNGDFGPARRVIQIPVPQQVPADVPAPAVPVTDPDKVPVPA